MKQSCRLLFSEHEIILPGSLKLTLQGQLRSRDRWITRAVSEMLERAGK